MEENMVFPLPSAEAVKNMVFTIYAKGQLLSKATGGNFYASDGLIEDIKQSESAPELFGLIESAGEEGLRGLTFTDETVIFSGFQEASDVNVVLATAIYNYCVGNHRVQPKRADTSNEKFSFRVWLVQLGLNGPEFKAGRKALYSHLTGHTAFRTKQDEERWKARRQARKAALA